jgi:hypothetical protein
MLVMCEAEACGLLLFGCSGHVGTAAVVIVVRKHTVDPLLAGLTTVMLDVIVLEML